MALGANEIKEWTNVQGGYSIDQFNQAILITAPGTYKFEALGDSGLGYIHRITVDPNCTSGTINLYVLLDPNLGGGPGAIDVTELDLTGRTATGQLARLHITGALGDYDHTVRADAITGDIDVGTGILSDLVVDVLQGDIPTPILTNVTVNTDTGSYNPTIAVTGSYSDGYTMTIHRSMHMIDIEGELAGKVDIIGEGHDIDYLLYVDTYLSGTVTIAGSLLQLMIGSDLSGTLDVAVDLGQASDSEDFIEILGDVSGTLAVGRDLYAGGYNGGLIDGWLIGTLTVGRDLPGAWLVIHGFLPGSTFTVGGDIKATLAFGGAIDGTLTMTNLLGTVASSGTLGGALYVNADVTEEGHIWIGTLSEDIATGFIHVYGSVHGIIELPGLHDPYDPNDPNSPPPLSGGYIITEGDLKNPSASCAICIRYAFEGDTEFIAVNYLGGATYRWNPDTTIRVDGNSYT